MNTPFQDTLFRLFPQFSDDPDRMPTIPMNGWQEGSVERQLLTGFHEMLERIQQRMQQALYAEEQLREKEAQYRSIFEASSDGIFIADRDGFPVEANPAACKMFGYSYDEFIGLDPTTFIHPDYLYLMAEHVQATRAGNQYQSRGVVLRKDGTSFLANAHTTPFVYKGQPHILAVIRDISEQVQAEQELREKEEQYHSIFEATTDGLIIADLDGYIVEANPAICNMFGYTYEEFVGLPATTITHPDRHHEIAEAILTIHTGHQQYYAQSIGIRKDGTEFYTEARTTPFIYKGRPHLLGVVRNISERVRAEEQLREKEAQYRGIFEASVDGLLISDLEGEHIVEANPAICEMNGYTREELLVLPPANLITAEYHHLVAESIQAIKQGGQFYNQSVALRKDGTTFHAESRGTTFTYKGEPHILTISRDITERVQVQEQLREKEAQYRSVFEASTDGLVINDLEDGHLVEVNPAMYKMHGYTYEEFMALHPMAFIHPDSHALFAEFLDTVKAGHLFHARATDVRKDGTPFPVEVHGTTFIYRGKPHVLAAVRDITEQMRAEEQLREKETQYRSIFEATTDGLVICDLEDGHVVEANPAACNIYGYAYEEFIGLPPGAIIHPEKLPAFMEKGLPVVRAGGERHTQGVNLRKDGSAFPVDLHQTAFTYQGKRHMLGVVRDITEQVQARQLLEQRVEERTRELSTLLEVSHNVASTIELKPLLDLILDQLKVAVDYSGSAITILEDEDLVFVGTRGPQSEEHLVQHRFPLTYVGSIWEKLCRREPVIIDNVRGDTPLAQAYRETVGELLETTFSYIRSWLAVPLMLKDRVIGLLSVSHSEPNYYTPRHAALALAIANQAAVAIENARLYEQAQELAAVEERQRLARELHDSVSQALYGISLGAHTARALLDRDPGKVAEPLSYVLTQAETALTEMRALIFELRPESLETEGLVAALGRQAAALQARHGIEVATDLGDELDLSLRVKQELYRIAQEALHNTVKHARANRVDMRMHWNAEGFLLEIGDDGAGFDPASAFPGHLGLHSMRERATRLGGMLQIESAPGHGTRIRLQLPASVRI